VRGGIRFDGIGHADVWNLTFKDGLAYTENFDTYKRVIRMKTVAEIDCAVIVDSGFDLQNWVSQRFRPTGGGTLPTANFCCDRQEIESQPF